MIKPIKYLFFMMALSIWSAGLWQIVNAQNQSGTPGLFSAPFIATDRKDSPDFLAQVGSTGTRSPYIFSTTKSQVPYGTYNGLIIKPESPQNPPELDQLSFAYKGTNDVAAVVHYNTPPSRQRGSAHLATASVNLNAGSSLGSTKDGYKKVSFTSSQLGLPKDNVIQKIVLVPPSESKAGKFMVDDIRVNFAPINKALETLFFTVNGGSATGPVGGSSPKAKLRQTTNGTSLIVTNTTGASVVVWLTLPTVCTPNSSCITSVTDIFPGMTCVAGGCFQGSQTLAAGQSLTYQPSASDPPGIQGAIITFNSAPTCGVGNYEFTINNDSQGQYAQETVNISLVNGNNVSAKFTLANGKGADWTTNYGLEKYKSAFQNYAGDNIGVTGVFPFACTNCTYLTGAVPCGGVPPTRCTTTGSGLCSPPDPTNCPQYCSFQRSAGQSGGIVTISYLGPPQAMPTAKGALRKILF